MKKVLTVLALIAFSTSVMAATSKIESFVNKAISPVTTAEKNLNTKVENQKKADAAEALKITSKDLLEMGIIDEEIPEPLGGAHTEYNETVSAMKKAISNALNELSQMSAEELRNQRYNKFRSMGKFIEA